MNLLAELLPNGLLQRTDGQASVITVFILPLSSEGKLACTSEADPRF